MGKLIHSFITSLDGYIEDSNGRFDWSVPDEEVHTFVNKTNRSVGTHLYGRRLYETMRYWETAHDEPGQPEHALEWARLWKAADKVVYSTTLAEPVTARTRIEREFDPAAIARMKAESEADITIGGPELAAHAIRAGLVDEYQQLIAPVIVGGGKPWLPDGVRVDLQLTGQRRFANGTVHLAYAAS